MIVSQNNADIPTITQSTAQQKCQQWKIQTGAVLDLMLLSITFFQFFCAQEKYVFTAPMLMPHFHLIFTKFFSCLVKT